MPFVALNLGRISNRFRNMASFPLKTHIFVPTPFSRQFENVFLALVG